MKTFKSFIILDRKIQKSLALARWLANLSDWDIDVMVEGYHFITQIELLSTSSLYFESVFSSDQFLNSGENVVELHGIDRETFESLLNYMHGGLLEITNDNVTRIYEASAYLRMRDVMQTCITLLERMVHVENCLEFMQIKRINRAPGLLEHIRSKVHHDLVHLTTTQAFLELTANQMHFLFERMNCNQEKTEIIFRAITRWILHDFADRRGCTQALLALVPTHFVSLQFLRTSIMSNKLLAVDPAACLWLMQNFTITNAEIEGQRSLYALKADLPAPVKDTHIMIMEDNLLLGVNVTSKTSVRLADYKTSEKCSAVSYRGDLYMFGGIRSRTALKYIAEENDWQEIGFPTYSSSEAACVLGDSVYFTGGFFNDTGYNTVYRYDFEGEGVQQYPKMKVRRSMHGVAGKDNCIYVCGGSTYSAGDVIQLKITERLDIREDKWSPLPGMHYQHGQCTAAIVSDYLYCSNIDNGFTERFNERQRRWEPIATAPGYSGTIVSYDDTLYRVYEDGVAEYCPVSDSWWKIAKLKLNAPVAISRRF